MEATIGGREKGGRQASVPAIKEDFEDGIISNPFVIINADADELPDPTDIENFQPGRKYHNLVTNTLVIIEMEDFYYNLHWSGRKIWNHAHTLPGDKVLMGLGLRDFWRLCAVESAVHGRLSEEFRCSLYSFKTDEHL